jgi:hypothetical protein
MKNFSLLVAFSALSFWCLFAVAGAPPQHPSHEVGGGHIPSHGRPPITVRPIPQESIRRFGTRKVTQKNPTSIATTSGSAMKPAATILTTASSILGNTVVFPAVSDAATFIAWWAVDLRAFGLAASISASLRSTWGSAAIGSGIPIPSYSTKIPTTTAGTWLTTRAWALTSTSCTWEPASQSRWRSIGRVPCGPFLFPSRRSPVAVCSSVALTTATSTRTVPASLSSRCW